MPSDFSPLRWRRASGRVRHSVPLSRRRPFALWGALLGAIGFLLSVAGWLRADTARGEPPHNVSPLRIFRYDPSGTPHDVTDSYASRGVYDAYGNPLQNVRFHTGGHLYGDRIEPRLQIQSHTGGHLYGDFKMPGLGIGNHTGGHLYGD